MVADNPWMTIPENGLGGKMLNPHLVLISIDPKYGELERVFSERLKRTLAHELYHCVRHRAAGPTKTLLEALVDEGLADHFVTEATNLKPGIWSRALPKSQIVRYLKRAEGEFNDKTYDHRAWFFGTKTSEIPRWTGYALGYYLVTKYFRTHADKKSSLLYTLPAAAFI